MNEYDRTKAQMAATIMAGMYAGSLDPESVDAMSAVGAAGDIMDQCHVRRAGDVRADTRTDAQVSSQRKIIEDRAEEVAQSHVELPDTSPNIRELGVSGRACAPLERMEIHTLWDLVEYGRNDIKVVKGVSSDVMKELDGHLKANGLVWGCPVDRAEAPEPEVDDDDDDVDDVL